MTRKHKKIEMYTAIEKIAHRKGKRDKKDKKGCSEEKLNKKKNDAKNAG